MVYTLSEQLKAAADMVAAPTAIVGGTLTLLGVIQSVVVIIATLVAGIYSAYRFYDLWDQRRKKKGK